MSEVKRISLKTVSNISNNNNNNNNSDKSENNKKSKDNNKSKDNKEPKTKRIVLELNNDCNEFSFNDLIKPNNDKNVRNFTHFVYLFCLPLNVFHFVYYQYVLCSFVSILIL